MVATIEQSRPRIHRADQRTMRPLATPDIPVSPLASRCHMPRRAQKLPCCPTRCGARSSLYSRRLRQVTSEVFGYRDWTELHSELGSKAASALDEACDSVTLTERRVYQASQVVASSVDLHGESADDFVRWWQPSAANPKEEGGGSTETPFTGSKEDLSFQEALSTLTHAAHHPVGHFEQALMTGIHRTENESSLRFPESIADDLLSGNRHPQPQLA